jgi:hypothetical protein
MSDESNVASRVVRWGTVAVLIGLGIGLYFRLGTRLEPLTSATGGGGAGTIAAPPSPPETPR